MSEQSINKILDLLNEMQIPYEIIYHPAVLTIEEMERLQLAHMDKVAKNLFLRDDKKRNYYLVMMKNNKSANLKEIRQKIGSKPLSFASEEDLHKYLGLRKGEVTPFGALNDTDNNVMLIIDNDLKNDEIIGMHPNDNTATVFLSLDDLTKILSAKGREIIGLDL